MGDFRKEAYEMQTLSCLYDGAGGPGELTFEVSPANAAGRFTSSSGGITVNVADRTNNSTYNCPVRFSKDYQNLVKVASIVYKDPGMDSTAKIAYLNRCQSFPSILRIEMLHLKPGNTITTKVHRKPNTDTYLFVFRNSKNVETFDVPFDTNYYKLPQGMMLYARADGIVVHYDSKISKLVAEFPLGTYAFSPDGTTPPFLRSEIQEGIYGALETAAGKLNVTADQIVQGSIQTNKTQQRLVMFAYIFNYQIDSDKVREEFAGRSGGRRRRRRSKSGGGGGSGSKKKLKKITRKRKNRSKSKSKN